MKIIRIMLIILLMSASINAHMYSWETKWTVHGKDGYVDWDKSYDFLGRIECKNSFGLLYGLESTYSGGGYDYEIPLKKYGNRCSREIEEEKRGAKKRWDNEIRKYKNAKMTLKIWDWIGTFERAYGSLNFVQHLAREK